MRILRSFIKERRFHTIFIYGDTLYHDGNGGQAREARGETNAYVVPVKLRKCWNDVTSFFDDRFYFENCERILGHLQLVPDDGRSIIIFPKLGEGRNELPDRAPNTYLFLMAKLRMKFHDRILTNYSDLLQEHLQQQARRNEDFQNSP